MKKILSYFLFAVLFPLQFYSCSEDNPVSPTAGYPPDSIYFSNISARIPQWILNYALADIEVIGAKYWISSPSGVLIMSDDSGATFNRTIFPDAKFSSFRMFQDGLTGFITGSRLFKTIDGGYSWNTVPVNLGFVSNLQFFSPSVFFAIGNTDTLDYIAFTSDGGSSWSYKQIYLTHAAVMKTICIPDSTDFSRIFIGTDRGVFMSANSGNNWTRIIFKEGNPVVNRFVYRSKNKFWLCANNGIFYLYQNGGWYKMKTTPDENFTSVGFTPDGVIGWASCNKNYLYRSENSGNDWKKIYYSRERIYTLLDLKVISPVEAYFTGYYGFFYRFKK